MAPDLDSIQFADLIQALQQVPVEMSDQLATLIRDAPLPMDTLGVRIEVHMEDSSAYGMGNALVDLDREFRRAFAFLERPPDDAPLGAGASLQAAPRQLQPARGRGQLEVIFSKRDGSIDLLLVGLGELARLMLSDPVQLALTFHWFWERRPQRWGIRRPQLPSAAEAISAQVNESALAAIAAGRSVEYAISFGADGGCNIGFRSIEPGTPRDELTE